MGREARCACEWGERERQVTALLESSELIVRGAVRARAPLHALEDVAVRSDRLEFTIAGERVALALGESVARRWALAIAAEPPALDAKLGIGAQTQLHIRGRIDDAALAAAVASAAGADASLQDADLAILRTDDAAALDECAAELASTAPAPPLWVIYVKGRGAPLGETAVRACLRMHGFVDVKSCAVSERLSALKFARRKT